MSNSIAIVDLGGQYCHLISRRLRDLGVWSKILPADAQYRDLAGFAGIILSGGPRSVYEQGAPLLDPKVLELGVPVLGICYGHQLLAKTLGAPVEPGEEEYGATTLCLRKADTIFRGTPPRQTVWMSHSDSVTRLPRGMTVLAQTERCKVAAFADFRRRLFGVQFHPEVVHTEHGTEVLRNFATRICGLSHSDSVHDWVPDLLGAIRAQVAKRSVFFFVSGGVDSTVAFALCAKALPRDRLRGVYVDTGLMRKGETEELRSALGALGFGDRLEVRNEASRFLDALRGVVDPEEKRRIIGRVFIEVQADVIKNYRLQSTDWLLGQGTIYPDTIESGGTPGSALIKTHHNRCEEVKRLIDKGLVLEPLAQFYKDEVRQIGASLGLDKAVTGRWPFPGPGLAIRCLCTPSGPHRQISPITGFPTDSGYEAVQVPLRSVGVQGDARTYRDVMALRGPLDYDRLHEISSQVCNVGRTYNRVIVLVSKANSMLTKGRVLGRRPLSAGRIELLREADFVVRQMMMRSGAVDSVWQFPVVLTPISFGGGESIVLRPIKSQDGMTARFARIPQQTLRDIADAVAAIPGVDAVFLDVTDKPPATIEWE